MVWAATAVAAVGVVGSAMGARSQAKAAGQAADAQVQAAQLATEEQRRSFDAIQKLLSPYSEAAVGKQREFDSAAYFAAHPDVAADPYYGQHAEEHYQDYGYKGGFAHPGYTQSTTGSLQAQESILGLNGQAAQQAAISSIERSPQFASMMKQGENALLQNASATGGLRGGNTQAALAQFRPQLLNQLINEQYSKLGGITSIGQNAAAGTGNAGMQSASNIGALLQQSGAAQAGSALAQGRAQAGLYSGLGNAAGAFAGMGGFGSSSPTWSFGSSGQTTGQQAVGQDINSAGLGGF